MRSRTSGRSMAGLRMSPSSPPVQHTSVVWTPCEAYSETVPAPFDDSSSGWAWTVSSERREPIPATYRRALRLRLARMSIPPEPARRPRPVPPSVLTAAVALVAATLLAACGTTGRTLRPPPPGATAPTTASTFSTATSQGAAINTAPTTAGFFVLSSAAFAPGATLPTPYTCDGAGNPPPLTWSDIPKGTVELVLALSDPDAGGYVHWMVAGIPPTRGRSRRRPDPSGAVVLANSKGTHAYTPPCPPAGQSHSYEFTLYALSKPSGLTASSDAKTAIARFDRLTPGPAVLTADYARPKK